MKKKSQFKNNYTHQIIFDKRKKKILNYNQNKKKIYISPEYFINNQIQKGDVIGI
jgi:hypothetical protein